ncbi:MAG: hypothetical protein AAFW00_24365, partial [Bacteroidota bacterium]
EYFRIITKNKFRENFINFFNDKEKSDFHLYLYQKENPEEFVESNFRLINGKCIKTKDEKLILAVHKSDNSMTDLLIDFEQYNLE